MKKEARVRVLMRIPIGRLLEHVVKLEKVGEEHERMWRAERELVAEHRKVIVHMDLQIRQKEQLYQGVVKEVVGLKKENKALRAKGEEGGSVASV